jgi:hypothetical protein
MPIAVCVPEIFQQATAQFRKESYDDTDELDDLRTGIPGRL